MVAEALEATSILKKSDFESLSHQIMIYENISRTNLNTTAGRF